MAGTKMKKKKEEDETGYSLVARDPEKVVPQ
jgi:hypothetical protein